MNPCRARQSNEACPKEISRFFEAAGGLDHETARADRPDQWLPHRPAQMATQFANMDVHGPIFDMETGRPGRSDQVVAIAHQARFLDQALKQAELNRAELGRSVLRPDRAQAFVDLEGAETHCPPFACRR